MDFPESGKPGTGAGTPRLLCCVLTAPGLGGQRLSLVHPPLLGPRRLECGTAALLRGRGSPATGEGAVTPEQSRDASGLLLRATSARSAGRLTFRDLAPPGGPLAHPPRLLLGSSGSMLPTILTPWFCFGEHRRRCFPFFVCLLCPPPAHTPRHILQEWILTEGGPGRVAKQGEAKVELELSKYLLVMKIDIVKIKVRGLIERNWSACQNAGLQGSRLLWRIF